MSTPAESLAHSAALLRGAVSFFEIADRFGAMVSPDAKPLERPAPIERRIWPLSPSKWPDCPICARDVIRCECDSDDYQAAVLTKLRATIIEQRERAGE